MGLNSELRNWEQDLREGRVGSNWNSARVHETQRHRSSNCGVGRTGTIGTAQGSGPFNFFQCHLVPEKHDFRGKRVFLFEHARRTKILIFTFFRAAPKSVKVKFELRRGGEKNKSGRALRKCGRHICNNGQTAKVLRVFHLRQKTG